MHVYMCFEISEITRKTSIIETNSPDSKYIARSCLNWGCTVLPTVLH